MAINAELEDLYISDKEDRQKYEQGKLSQIDLQKCYKARMRRIRIILFTLDEKEIWNCHHASYMILNSDNNYDYELAHEYAKKAIQMGSNVNKWLYAATLDRWLVSQGKKQRYGTQFKKVKGKWQLLPVDETVTDIERENYGVPPLHAALEHFQKKYSKFGEKVK